MLIISDSPAGSTGLGRVSRELATRIQLHLGDKIQIATLGFGAQPSSRLNWPQYTVRQLGSNRELPDLPDVCRDFFNGDKGVIFAIMNPGWLEWLAHPNTCVDTDLKACLQSGQFEHWIYAPIDAEGPSGLPHDIRSILDGFDRRLFYTRWAANLYGDGSEYLPHGIDGTVFYPRDRVSARRSFMQRVVKQSPSLIPDDILLVGCVATNTPRKDWPLAFATVAELVKRGENAVLWAHTDSFYHEYDFANLTESFSLNTRVIPTKHYLSSDALAWAYSACDITLGIGSGEGFGYPLAESRACGTCCLHGNYAGGVEIVTPQELIEPVAWRYDGIYCHKRPVFDPKDWADRVIQLKGSTFDPDKRFHWNTVWPAWSEWLLRGIK